MFLQTAVEHELTGDYIYYGNVILTTAILSILICAPTGAILINSLGPIYLSKDTDVPPVHKKDVE
jgi:hypothetical protein